MFVVFSNLLCLRVFSIILVDATREIKISSQSTLRFVNFVEYPSHNLDTTKRIQASNVGKDLECSMKCFNTPSCTSLNMASAEDEDNTLWCELLFDDIFNNSQNLKQNSTSRHVTKWVSWFSVLCFITIFCAGVIQSNSLNHKIRPLQKVRFEALLLVMVIHLQI